MIPLHVKGMFDITTWVYPSGTQAFLRLLEDISRVYSTQAFYGLLEDISKIYLGVARGKPRVLLGLTKAIMPNMHTITH